MVFVRRKVIKRNGFKLIDILVVIVIIVLFVGLLIPALSRVREFAIRAECKTSLKGIGDAFVIYAHDGEGDYSCAGGFGATWSTKGTIVSWYGGANFKEDAAFSYTLNESTGYIEKPGEATITSSLYLLIRYCKATPDLFLCRGDKGVEVFEFARHSPPAVVPADGHKTTLQDVFDFGQGGASPDGEALPLPGQMVSYSYHMPSVNRRGFHFNISDVFGPGSPVAADRNPYLDKNASPEDIKKTGGNSANHQGKGQNVLYKNGGVSFKKTPQAGVGGDNIYTYGGDPNTHIGDSKGTAPNGNGDGAPVCMYDAYLVLETNYK